jgi:hypothetical protein
MQAAFRDAELARDVAHACRITATRQQAQRLLHTHRRFAALAVRQPRIDRALQDRERLFVGRGVLQLRLEGGERRIDFARRKVAVAAVSRIDVERAIAGRNRTPTYQAAQLASK